MYNTVYLLGTVCATADLPALQIFYIPAQTELKSKQGRLSWSIISKTQRGATSE